MKIKDFLKLEREHRTAGKWWCGHYNVTNDHGVEVKVAIKSHGFYNQILKINDSEVNYCSGHTIEKVGKMHAHLKETINSVV